jgi:four helix bundle protein
MPSFFENLVAYRLAGELGDAIRPFVVEWPTFDRWTTGKQLVEAADSIGANIAEGAGRLTEADRRHFFVIARGSLLETEHWLKRAKSRGLVVPDLATDELARVLNGLIRTAGRD